MITFDPNVMGGKACIRGMRVAVSLILNLVANGMSAQEIIAAYPFLVLCPELGQASVQLLHDMKSVDHHLRMGKLVQCSLVIRKKE